MSSAQPIEFMTVHELSDAMISGELTSQAVVERYLDRIERLDPKLRAFVHTYADDARWASAATDQLFKTGHRLGPLHGIPIAIKDIIDMEGRTTTGGSTVWRDRISPYTATLVRRLIGAGMIVLGKTHSVEFAMGGWGTNNSMGTPHNPWDLDVHRAPGGSSSGSGVAVAAGLSPCAIGTDTGGSVRLPSAWNGLTGLKTTIGRVSCHGVLPLASTLDTPGPMCRDAEDAALLFGVLHGPDAHDPLTFKHCPIYPMETLRKGVAGLRLGTLGAAEREQVDAEVLAAYDESLGQLQALGATLTEINLPISIAKMGELVGQIISIEGYSFVGHLTDDPKQPIDPDIRPRIKPGRGVTATEYLHLLRLRQDLMRDVNFLVSSIDAWITPATCTVAPPVADIDQSTSPAVFTRPVNLLDWCALVMPAGFSQNGLPMSVQVACGAGHEDMALRIGHAFQQVTDWHKRTPPGLG
jgi:aspartyl-tRNA(Asn)/glutamyl-tRNA(Gln) amidotransferase subunit A